jgi:hypothetical protein
LQSNILCKTELIKDLELSTEAVRQIDAIHSMLSTGHRNLRMERHSLVLWGLAGGLLFAISDYILTPAQFPDIKNRAIAWLLLLSAVFSAVGVLDWHLTRKIKAERDEVWSFIHRQVMKIWWLIIAIGCLLTFAMFFFGGGYMVAAAWLVLLGLGLFIHGLFSEVLLEWAGGAVLLTGIATLAFHFQYATIQWIAASVFGLGLPLLALILNRRSSTWRQALQLLVWLLLVILPPLLIQRHTSNQFPNVPTVSLATFQTQSQPVSRQIVTLPQGTLIPVRIILSGDLFRSDPKLVLPFSLARPIDILIVDGKPTRNVRYSDGDGQVISTGGWINIPAVSAELTPAGPLVNTQLIVDLAPH